jgi:hypothetical protein
MGVTLAALFIFWRFATAEDISKTCGVVVTRQSIEADGLPDAAR